MIVTERQAIADLLQTVWAESYERLLERLEAVLTDPRKGREARNLRELLAAHEAEMGRVATGTRTWWAGQVPTVYAAGVSDMAVMAGSRVAWGQVHQGALEHFVTRTWDDVAGRLRGIDSSTRAVIRGWARDATRAGLMEARTAVQAGRDLTRVASSYGMWSVTYANGAEVPMSAYAQMLARTTTATAYNDGSLLQAGQDGIEWVEYMDSPDCGITSHNDPEKANGKVVRIEDAIQLSHPNCVRALAPAPFYSPVLPAPDLAVPAAQEPHIAVYGPRSPRALRR